MGKSQFSLKKKKIQEISQFIDTENSHWDICIRFDNLFATFQPDVMLKGRIIYSLKTLLFKIHFYLF